MARKEITVDIQDREQLLTFKIKEMSASQLENWLYRASLLLADSGILAMDSSDLASAGEYLLDHGLTALGSIDMDRVQPLLNDLLSCCYIKIDKLDVLLTPANVDDHIQDVKTMLHLRKEAIKLNLGFIMPEIEKLSGFRAKPNTDTL